MHKDFPRPVIFSSKCLGFAACRWNGVTIPDKFVAALKPYADFVTACPEAEIGLGIPRDPIRIVFEGGSFKLMQLNTGRDVTGIMKEFSANLLGGIKEIDGFILKDRSPSCGMKDVKVYPNLKPCSAIKKRSGFFAEEVQSRFPRTAIETEARLSNYVIREQFLTRIFISAKFRKLQAEPSMKALVQFHAENKLLLLAYNQKELRLMGKIVANHEKKDLKTVFSEYGEHLYEAFAGRARQASCINVLMHAMGYFSEGLSSDEKKFFLNSLEEYRRDQVTLSVPVNLLRSYVVRFKEEYLAQQTFFEPYPHGLLETLDSGKGRTLA